MSTMLVAAALGTAFAFPLSVQPAVAPSSPLAGAALHAARPLATAALWPPPESAQRRMRRRRPMAPIRELPGLTGESTEALEQEVFGDDQPTTTTAARRLPPRRDDARARARASASASARDDDDDDDDDLPRGGSAARALALLPPIIAPHAMTFGLGTSLMGRSFSFNAPLQPDSGFPREGVVAQLESFPLLHTSNAWYARFGAGASFSTEIGSAGLPQADGGTLTYGVSERRWSFDIRYALPLGERFLIVPLVGFGHSGYDLERRAQPAPSTCTASSTQVCLPDVQLSHLTFGFDARFALRPTLALSLGAGLLPGFGVGRGAGQLGVESDASALGVSVDAGVSWQLLDWLALRAALPITHYSYAFSHRPLSYTSASETYYGVVIGATVFVR